MLTIPSKIDEPRPVQSGVGIRRNILPCLRCWRVVVNLENGMLSLLFTIYLLISVVINFW